MFWQLRTLVSKLNPKGIPTIPGKLYISAIVIMMETQYVEEALVVFMLYLLGTPVSWHSKLQKSVLLSSLELEYIAMSEAANANQNTSPNLDYFYFTSPNLASEF